MFNQLTGATFATVISVAIAGCAGQGQQAPNWIIPTTEEFDAGDFGEYPEKYKHIVTRHVLHNFVEPKLGHISSPNRHYAGIIGDPERPLQFGYLVCAGFDAKNKFGRDTGTQMYGFLIKNGKVVTWWPPTVLQKNFCMQDVSDLDFGKYPENYEQVAKNSLHLKDPYSAVYEKISKPIRYHNFDEYVKNPRISPFLAGHLVCVTVNAKNSYGGYTGYTTYGVVIVQGIVGLNLGNVENSTERWATECGGSI